MHKLSPDETFHFELLRILAHVAYGAADAGEVLVAAGEIAPGDFESWYGAWHRRAERVLASTAAATAPDNSEAPDRVSARDAMFRAATYLRAADFFLHGVWEDDPRVRDLWARQAACFDRGIALLDVPGRRAVLRSPARGDGADPGLGFEIPVIFFAASRNQSVRRPTIVLGNGYDGSMEELYHLHGAAAVERGYNVVVYEGPGQPTVRRAQGLGFVPEWERVVSPVLDYLETLPSVDTARVGLLGYSMGALLAARAAAFEPDRIAALFLVDGLYDFAATPVLSREHGLAQFAPYDDPAALRAALAGQPTGMRWALSHGLWCFNVRTPREFVEKARGFSLEGIADRIRCPVFVGDPAEDMFFAGQPKKMVEALGDKATLFKLTDEDGAGLHCHVGASRYVSHLMYSWFEEKVVKRAQ